MSTTMPPTITLREIGADNYNYIARLWHTLTQEERGFVAHNALSILEAHYNPENLFARGIYHAEKPVGFVLYGNDPDTGKWWVVRLMVAKAEQGKGYGRAGLQTVIDLLREKTDVLYISFAPENETGRRLYASMGFQDTGEIDEGEIVYKLTF